MQTQEFLKASSGKLAALYPPEEAFAIAKNLLEEVTQLSSIQILLNTPIPPQYDIPLQQALTRLLKAEPLQYVVGKAYFCRYEFQVQPGVLIPRPETEELVSHILKTHENAPHLQILDCCTGSGCIAIALRKSFPSSAVWATELSTDALSVAKENAHKLGAPIRFIQHDIFKNADALPTSLDILVSNPPYVRYEEETHMHDNVAKFEPVEALYVPNSSPLLFYERLLKLGRTLLRPQGNIYLEINEAFPQEMQQLATSIGWENVQVWKDFRGKYRFLSASNPSTH